MRNIPLKGDAHSINFYEFLKFRKILKLFTNFKTTGYELSIYATIGTVYSTY